MPKGGRLGEIGLSGLEFRVMLQFDSSLLCDNLNIVYMDQIIPLSKG
jgi:hypothetical protein